MAIITLEQMKKKLNWENIRLEEDGFEEEGKIYKGVDIIVISEGKDLPNIIFPFDEEMTSFECVLFSNWHDEYHSYKDERRNLVRAIQDARKLIKHELCLIEELDEQGTYIWGYLLEANCHPQTITSYTKTLRCIFFNKEPKEESVDFSKYTILRGEYVLKEAQAEVEKKHKQMDKWIAEHPYEY